MKMKTVLVLAFAIGCGLIAMMGVQQMIAKQGNQKEEAPINVLVATVDISPGVLLNTQNCEFREFPAKGVPHDAVRSKEQYNERGLLVPVMAGDIIRQTKLGARGDIAASASIPPGMRTVSIQVNDTKTHSGLLQPGDRIDLQVTYEVRNADSLRLTKSATLLEYIEVFASDAFRNLEAGESKEINAKNITLLVTPEQANIIQLANRRGELVPIMRSRTDKTLVNPEGLDEVALAELRTGMVQDQAELDREKDKDKSQQTAQAQPDSNQKFRDFLEKMAVAPEPQPVQTPNPDSWTITIYAGDNIITQEVQLPGAQRTPPTGTPVPSPGRAPGTSQQPQPPVPAAGMMSPTKTQAGVPKGTLTESMKQQLLELFDQFQPARPHVEPPAPERPKPEIFSEDVEDPHARRDQRLRDTAV